MSAYYPGPGSEWERIDPREAGFVPERLETIAGFHAAHESGMARAALYHPNGEYVRYRVYRRETALQYGDGTGRGTGRACRHALERRADRDPMGGMLRVRT